MAQRNIIGKPTRLLAGVGILCTLAMLAQAAHPAPGEFVATTTPLAAHEAGSILGEVTPATPVKIVATTRNRSEIAVVGWSMRDAPQYLYPEIGQRIILVKLDQAGRKTREVESTRTDKYGVEWNHVKVTGWIPSTKLTTDPSTIWHTAKTIFHKRCTACHALHHPKEFTANQWPSILKIMTKRAALSPADAELVTKYLQLHAKGTGTGETPGPKAGMRMRMMSGRGGRRN